MRKLSILLALSIFISPGCGGGSRGTGTLTIDGKAFTTKGTPIRSANVTNLETGAATQTDDSGSFSLVTERLSGKLSFLLETSTLQVTSQGGNEISDDIELVEVRILVDTDKPLPTAKQEIKPKNKPNSGSSSSSSSSNSSSSSSSGGSSSSSSISSGSSSSGGSSSQSSSSNSSSSSSSEDDDDEVRVEGPIQSKTSNTLTVRSTTFTVDNETDFDDRQNLSQYSIGERVEVRGKFKSGTLFAKRIKLKD